MSNTPLEQNGIDLDSVLAKVNALPQAGITPTGSITLTEEKSYDVTEKATAVVDFSATRANLAEAVTAKGVDTLPTASFDTIATNIGLISGGTEITDGIVVKQVNEAGYITEIDFYGDTVYPFQFGQGSNNTAGFMYLEKVNFKTPCHTVSSSGFAYCRGEGFAAPIPKEVTRVDSRAYGSTRYKSFDFPISLTGRLSDNIISANTYAESFKAPGITSLATDGGNGNGQFYSCTNLKNVEIGSVGYGITNSRTWNFRNCTQSDLTITLYCAGSYADTLLSNIRSSATNATIIIKASEDTTYGGNSYLAGETMITSTP